MLTAGVIYLFALGEPIDVLLSKAAPGPLVCRGARPLDAANQSTANMPRTKSGRNGFQLAAFGSII